MLHWLAASVAVCTKVVAPLLLGPSRAASSPGRHLSRLQQARLYLCTDARRDRGDLAEFADAALAGGVDIIQLRDKGSAGEHRLGPLEARDELAAWRSSPTPPAATAPWWPSTTVPTSPAPPAPPCSTWAKTTCR